MHGLMRVSAVRLWERAYRSCRSGRSGIGADDMSYIHTKLAWQLDIPSTDKLVLLALCHFADEEGHCYPSVTTVARMVGITRRHCQRLMSELINQSFVAVVGNERGGVRTRDY